MSLFDTWVNPGVRLQVTKKQHSITCCFQGNEAVRDIVVSLFQRGWFQNPLLLNVLKELSTFLLSRMRNGKFSIGLTKIVIRPPEVLG